MNVRQTLLTYTILDPPKMSIGIGTSIVEANVKVKELSNVHRTFNNVKCARNRMLYMFSRGHVDPETHQHRTRAAFVVEILLIHQSTIGETKSCLRTRGTGLVNATC